MSEEEKRVVEESKVVCVTGASGFIASWLVKLLLNLNYTVHATLRNPNDQTKIKHLLELEGAKERLFIFKADLMEEGSFDSAISGCVGVFHTASPVLFSVNDPQVDVLDPAIKGTLNVLTSCKKFPSVRRVVLTSSMAAVVYNGKPRAPEVVVDETWFSVPELCQESSMKWYTLSKTLAEDAAWKFAKENGLDMISINPGMVIGPMLQPTLNSSIVPILNLINGAKTYPNATFGWVNVKDVATAHILAFEVLSASGRYILVETVAHLSEIAKDLQDLYPTLALPDKCADDKPFVPSYQVSKEKVKSLGVHYIPLNECYLLSKTLVEDAAWKFAKAKGIDMLSMNPGAVIGPVLQSTMNLTTAYYVLNLINGSETYPNAVFGWIHVKDVAEAHIRALEIPFANGRYILSETVAHFSELVKILHELYPNLKLPNKCEDDEPLEPTFR